MNKIIKIDTWLPIFPGFYNTDFEYDDGDIEYNLFNNPDSIDKTLYDFVIENVWENIDYEKYQNDVVKICVDYIECLYKDYLPDIIKKITYQHIVSPKQYNFTNDSINITVELDFNGLLKKFINHPESSKFLKERYTSYSGFISSYSNDMKGWIENVWDDNSHAVGSMMEFFLLVDNESNYYENEMSKVVAENIYISEYIKYSEIIKQINDKFTFNDELTEWDCDELENYIAIVGGTFSDQLMTGIGLFEKSPESIPENDFLDNLGMYKLYNLARE